VERSTHQILDLFDEHHAKATFFVLGWVAERHVSLVRQIRARGHEIACHSYLHQSLYKLSLQQLRDDTSKAKHILEDITGEKVSGYRAPSFSITRRNLWVLEELASQGFRYDSSIYPIRHDLYGIAGWPRAPVGVKTAKGPILEIPGSTVRLMGSNVPCGGGGYLRVLPFHFNAIGLRKICKEEKALGVIYVHPWEFDPDQPRISAPLRSRIRHYTGLRRTEGRLSRILSQLAVGPVRDVLSAHLERIGNGRCELELVPRHPHAPYSEQSEYLVQPV
jgi:polysaccharide deacetylase family protein (PEP-CTERM system associated)